MGEGKVKQMTSWAARKYGRLMLAGGLSTFLMLNITLHAGASLHYYCSHDCLEALLTAPISSLDPDAIFHLRDHWLDPPAPPGTYKAPFPLEHPPWSTNGSWNDAYKLINNYFKQYQIPGKFVEVGAADGGFRSLTLWVEQQLGFRGLLVEPNPETYQALRAAGRSAQSIQACATPEEGHRQDLLWIRDEDVNLPSHLRQLQKGSNRLLQYVPVEDRDLGRTVPVQCFNLGALVVAAFRSVTVDLLVMSTHGGEIDILTTMPPAIKVKVLVVVSPIVSSEEMNLLLKVTKRWALAKVIDQYDMHVFVPKEYVAYT